MRLGILGNEGSWYVHDLTRAADSRGHQAVRIDFPKFVATVGCDRPHVVADDIDLPRFDAIIVRTMPPGTLEQVVFRMDALAQLSTDAYILNSPKAIECAVDKYLTTCNLANVGLPVPATITCEDAEAAMMAFEWLGGDVVVKPIFGSEGRGICRVSDPDLAFRTFRTLARLGAVLYLQRYIDHPGFDVRVVVLDGAILGGMIRRNGTDFRTNVARQGSIEPHVPTSLECEWALQAARSVGATFAGVDILYDREGTGWVIEVNAVPGWRAFGRATGIDVAAKVIQFLESQSTRSI
ncbi:ATP-grasp domain-containing protein [Thalassoroseus pseudoceratinae]|uniref:ATP-grasp domain-containing protein n=1 Tax=Thalassoroseus pseudoceratinae TaxID=2713176 RepID=UPI00142098D2|nr:RimK family alpha-L-glutamate ligase [Thalassoroseus pseudoceratinae]